MDALANAFADADRSYMAASKAVGGSVPRSLVGGMPSVGSFSSSLSKAGEQYQHYRGWVYVAVRAIASRIAGQSVCIGRVGSKSKPGRKLVLPQSFKSVDELIEPLPSHPFLTAVASPNQFQTQWSLLYSTVGSMLLTGRSSWLVIDDEGGELQIWPIPSHWIEPTDRFRSGWKLRPPWSSEGIDMPPESIIPFILPDPSNPMGLGCSPLQSQALAVATDEEIQRSQFAAFQNGVFPSLAFKIGRLPGMVGQEGENPILEPEQRLELVNAVKRQYQGGSRAGEPLILDGLIESVDKISNSPDEMDYLDSGNQTKNRIMQAFGVNPVVAGQLESANKASSFTASMHFAESTCNPLIEQISQTLTRFACTRFSTPTQKLVAWIEPVKPNDSEQKLSEWKAALAAGVVTPNEFRAAILNLDAMSGGDTIRDALGNPVEPAKSVAELSANGHRFN